MPGYSLGVAASVARSRTASSGRPCRSLVPYEPGKPVEEVQRELGLDRCVKLASNEGPFGPFPAALEALAQRCRRGLNRYPDGGAWRLRDRARRAPRRPLRGGRRRRRRGRAHRLPLAGHARPGRRDRLRLAVVPELRDRRAKLGATPGAGAAARHRYDLEAMLEAIGPRTKLVYVCHPNNPTGTINTRAELDAFLDARARPRARRRRPGVPRVRRRPRTTRTRSRSTSRPGRRIAVLRTFSKIYGLAGLRVGYMVAPPEVVTAANKVKRAFDVSSAAQEAALASLDDAGRDRAARGAERRRRWPRSGRRPARQRLRAGRARGRQLRLRRDGERQPAAVRGAARARA